MNQDVKEKLISVEDMQSGLRETYNVGIGNEGVCSTAADTAAKTVTLGTTFSLTAKATIIVTFTHGITVDNATLAVTHTTLAGTTVTETAKPIYLKGAALEGGTVEAGSTLILRYDGTNFNIIGGIGEGGPDAAYVGDYDSSAGAPGFDAFADTVHVTEQTLNETKKAQARANIGAEVISYDPSTGMLRKTVGDTTTGIVSIVNSGFDLMHDSDTGTDTFTAIGTATLTHDDETGTDEFVF